MAKMSGEKSLIDFEQLRQAGTGVHADRADQERRQRDHDEHRQERHEDQLDVLRDEPFRPLYSGPSTAAISSGGNTCEL